jgi:hypothetical protein
MEQPRRVLIRSLILGEQHHFVHMTDNRRTMYFDSKTYKPPPFEDTGGKALLDNWEASLLKVGDIDTVSHSIPLSAALTPRSRASASISIIYVYLVG